MIQPVAKSIVTATGLWLVSLACWAPAAHAAFGFFRSSTPPPDPRSGKWAHEGASLAPDPRVMWGQLDNGIRYALLPHAGVPERVVMQLIVLSGSLDERSDELGMAHFIEHMAFGGSKNFKAEDMVSLFQRLGVEYGSDVNAVTTFDHTAFRLDFHENTPSLIDEGLRLMRDFGDGVSFKPAIIEQERRIVLAELRNRNTLAGRQQLASLPVVFRGLHFPERSPGGSELQINRFSRDQFLTFYRRCYRPDLMVVVAVGDFEGASMVGRIREIFGSMVRPQEPIPSREEGQLDGRSLRAGVFRIGGVSSAATEAFSVFPLAIQSDSRETRIMRQKRDLVMDVFAERLRTQAPVGGGGDAGYDQLLGHGVSTATLGVPANAWAEGVRALDGLIRLTLERGFDTGQLDKIRRQRLQMASHMLNQVPTLDPGTLCEALTESITSHTVFEGFQQRFGWMRGWLQGFTAAEAQEVFKGLWNPGGMAYHVAGGVDVELTADKVVQEIQKIRRSGPGNVLPRLQRDTRFVLPRLGAPSAVVEEQDLPEINARLLRFGNNVRLNFVASQQEPGLVRAVVRIGAGLLEMPGNKPALKEFGLNTVLASGSVHFRPQLLSALIQEHLLEFSFDIDDRDAFTFRGVMSAEHLEVFFGLIADILQAPKFNSYVHKDEKLRAAMGRASETIGMQDGLRALTDHLFAGDARFTWGSPLDYVSMSVLDVRRWMEAALKGGYLEATVVGDLTEAQAVATTSRTLGALEPRAATKVVATKPAPVKLTAPAGSTRIEFVGEQNVGLVVGTWPVSERMHMRDQAALEVLAKVLELRVRAEMREKLGLAYSPSAEFEPYDGFSGFAVLQAQIDCAPNDTSKVSPLIPTIGARLAKEGIGEGEFIGARGILRSRLRQSFHENGFLSLMLMRAQERPAVVEEIVALRQGLMDKITRDEVNAWAGKIMPADNCRTAEIVPKPFVGIFEVGR